MNIILKFVTSYIRNHMSHENAEVRKEIFKAINEGMSDEFYEDNCPTRVYTTVKWLIESDVELHAIYSRNPTSLRSIAECAKDGVLESNILE